MMDPHNRIVMHRRGTPHAKTPSPPRDVRRWAAAYCIVACVAVALYLVRLPQWQIDRVEIFGTVKLDPAILQASALQVLDGSYFLLMPKSSYLLTRANAVAAYLNAEFPQIAVIRIRKNFPDMLQVEIKEREFWGVYCALPPNMQAVSSEDVTDAIDSDVHKNANLPATAWFPEDGAPEACALIDETGFAYEAAPVSTGAVLRKIYSDQGGAGIGTAAVPPHLMEFIRRAATASEGATGSVATHWYVLADYPNEIRMRVSDGFAVYFNTNTDLPTTFTTLQTVLTEEIKDRRSQLEYIDLRFGNKVFYKYKN